jgi:hypothetical protein
MTINTKVQVIPLNGRQFIPTPINHNSQTASTILSLQNSTLPLYDYTKSKFCGESAKGTLFTIGSNTFLSEGTFSRVYPYYGLPSGQYYFPNDWREVQKMYFVKSFVAHQLNKKHAVLERTGDHKGYYLYHTNYNYTSIRIPVDNAVKCTASKGAFAFLMDDGSVKMMGFLHDGIAGNEKHVDVWRMQNTVSPVTMPTEIVNDQTVPVKFVDVFGGNFHFIGLSQSGKLYAWGSM